MKNTKFYLVPGNTHARIYRRGPAGLEYYSPISREWRPSGQPGPGEYGGEVFPYYQITEEEADKEVFRCQSEYNFVSRFLV